MRIRLFLQFAFFSLVYSWPDGAPCVHAAFESMNPLEAVEHQGGLQLNEPPYEIAVDQSCYWANQPVGLTVQGKNLTIKFKGFAVQPYEWRNGRTLGRIGQFIRLDDNGSWQQQCFRRKDSATHSHDEKKKHIKLWWKSDDDLRTVQFVATVVEHIRKFWVKSVISVPIPPCRQSRRTENWFAPMPTAPPPVKAFKQETHRVFGKGGFQDAPFRPNKGQQQNSFGQGTTVSFFVEEAITQPPPPPPTTTTTTQPTTTTRRSTTAEPIRFFVTTTRKIVPNRPEQRFELVDGDSERDREEVLQPVRPRPRLPSRPQRPFKNRPETNTFVPVTQAPTFESTIRSTSQRFFVPESFIRQQQQAEAIRRRILAQQQEQIRQQLIQRQFQQQLSQQLLSQQQLSQQQLSQQPIVNNAVVCADFDSRCPAWIGHCPFNSFVTQRCPLSCGLCRFRIQ